MEPASSKAMSSMISTLPSLQSASVTCEEIVSDEYIRRDPTKTRIFGECVNAVVRAPYGAWPSQCYNYYDDDDKALTKITTRPPCT